MGISRHWKRWGLVALGCVMASGGRASAQTVVNADRAQITERATIGGSTFGEVLRVIGVSPVSGGSGTMNPWVLDANGDARKDTNTTVSTAGGWTFGTSPRLSSASPWLDWHENDAATDEKFMRWISAAGIFRLQSVNDAYSTATDLLSVDRAGVNATMSVAMPTIFPVNGASLSLAASGVDNVRLGVNTTGNTPRVILEDAGSPFQIQMDNLTGTFRVARLTPTGDCEAVGCVPFGIDDVVRFAPKGAAVLPITPYGFSIGSPLLPIHALYAGELNVQQLVSHEKMITQGARLGIARSTTLLEGITSASTTIKTKHNNINVGDRLWFEADGRFEFMAVTGGPTRINRCQANCDADNGVTYWSTTTSTVTWQREQRWQGEGAIQVAAVAVGDAIQTHPENFVPSTAYTVSLYIRRADGGVITPGPSAYVLFCGSFTGVQATALNIGAGWYRLYANCTSPASPNQAVGVTWLPNVVHYIDAVQIEAGSTLTDWSESASQYTVTRDLDGSGPTPWEAGAGILDTGTQGTAWIDAYAESSIRGKFNYGSKVLELSPVGYWRFGTHGFTDSSVNNATWTMNGSTIVASSGVGGGTSDGQGGAYQAGTAYLSFPDAPYHRIIGDLTIEMFLYWPSDTTGYIVAKGTFGRGEFDLHWIAGSGGHIRYAHGNGSSFTAVVEACTNGSIPLTTYTHVAIVRDTTNQQILCYINGALNLRSAYTTTPTFTADPLVAFARADGSYSEPAGKHIDELAIFPRMLSADEVKEHYDARLRTLPETQYGPTVVGNVRFSGTWNDWRPYWAIGNLAGTYDYNQNIFGFVAGNPAQTWVSVDVLKGFRIMSGTTEKLRADTSGNLSLTGALTVGTAGHIKSGAADISTGSGFYMDAVSNGRFRVGNPASFRMEWNTPTSLNSLKLISPGMTLDENGITLGQSAGVSEAGKIVSWAGTGAILWDSSLNNEFQIIRPGGRIYLRAGASSSANDGIVLHGGSTGLQQSYLNVTPMAITVNATGATDQTLRSQFNNTMRLGDSTHLWRELWLTETTTGDILYPLVSALGQVKAKTDGSTINFTCGAGQAVKSMNIEYGIVVGVACGAP